MKIYGQTYDNWIKYDQPYFKIEIAEDGIYRIDYLDLSLQAIALQLSSTLIPSHNLQLFHLGKEVPIHVEGGDDGVFFIGDYILFHGIKNDGILDEALYENREDMANPYYSLFSDTSVYYLTFKPGSTAKVGLRYIPYNLVDPAAPIIKSYSHESVVNYNSSYSYGKPYTVFGENFHYSEYKEGEGWIGPRFGYNQGLNKRIEAIPTNAVDRSSTSKIDVEFNIIGLSNDGTPIKDHYVEVSIGPDVSSFSKVYDTLFDGYSIINKKLQVPMANLGNINTYLEFLPLKAGSINAHGNGLGFVKINYPRLYDFTNETYFKFKANPSTLSNNLEFKNYGKGVLKNPIVFDETNNLMFKPNLVGRDFVLNLPARAKESVLITEDQVNYKSTNIKGVYLRNLGSLSDTISDVLYNCEYNIISTKRLKGNELDEYFGYKKNKYKSSLVYMDELYDAFSYGVKHPLAIRRYCEFISEKYKGVKPEYLLLLGRGFENQLHRKSGVNTSRLTVPTIGVPASDIMFSYKIKGSGVRPVLSTGRLAFDSKYEISNYLDKLKKYENSSDLALWRKEIVHLGGGKDGGQAAQILGILNKIGNVAKSEPFGGLTTTFSKAATGIVSPFVKESTVRKINEGVNLVTFLGHGSSTFLDLDIGDTTDLTNYGRYPIYFFNGCNIGNPNLGFNSNGELFYSEQVLKAKDKGGIAFIGQSSTSELNTVNRVMHSLYNEMFKNGYGSSLGTNLKLALGSVYTQTPSELGWLHVTQTFYQGDPTIVSYSPQLPDYVITDQDVFIYPEDAIALSDSFAIAVIVDNAGKVVTDTCTLKVTRTYPDLIRFDTAIIDVPPVSNRDTFYIWMKSKDVTTAGDNYLDIEINGKQKFLEFTYLNNRVVNKEFVMRSNGVNLIYPRKFDIVRKDTVKLVVNAMNITENPQDFLFEMDTTPYFNSPFLKQPGHVQSAPLASVTFPLLAKDSVVYYWRCKLGRDKFNGGLWKQQSFTNIKANPSAGWSQAHFPEFYSTSNDKIIGLSVDTLGRKFSFGKLERGIWVDTDRRPRDGNKGVKLGGGFESKDINPGICWEGLVVMLFNKNTLELEYHPTMDPLDLCPNGDSYNGSQRQIYYNFRTQFFSGWNLFDSFMRGVPEGTHVAIFSKQTTHLKGIYDGWDPKMFDALHSIGSKVLDNIDPKDPNTNADLYQFVCVGQKGLLPGEATEMVVYGAYAAIEARMIGQRSSGTIYSEPIGPASEWGRAYFNVEKENQNDSFELSIIGVRRNLPDIVLFENIQSTDIDLSLIDAVEFPYLKLQGDFKDIEERTSPQLKNWRVTFSSMPEGLINVNRGYEDFNGRDTLLEGEIFNSKFAFENISGYGFDSILVTSKLEQTLTRKVIWTDTVRISPLQPFEWDYYSKNIETKGFKGLYSYKVRFNSGNDQPELDLSNNLGPEEFFVKVDVVNPILDVTFDGKHIVNGDLVSSQPRILITSKDENKVLLQDDTARFILYLKSPNSSDFVELKMDGNELQYYPATNATNMAIVEYSPSNLIDGEYTLKVQTLDKSGNEAGPKPHEIVFKVINETSISNFYPYPNPFTSQTRFVFTLTGNEIPDYINIKIMTISGKVVKEITKEELGNITIGNNISEYAWNATDEFGDRLANGVYLYKVTVRHDGKEVKPYSTAGDGSFKENMGKLYIMR